MKKHTKKQNDESIWEEGSFAQTMSSRDMKEKMKTFHMKHDEDMNYNCHECSTKISAHQRDWHDCMCETCFDRIHFPERQR